VFKAGAGIAYRTARPPSAPRGGPGGSRGCRRAAWRRSPSASPAALTSDGSSRGSGTEAAARANSWPDFRVARDQQIVRRSMSDFRTAAKAGWTAEVWCPRRTRTAPRGSWRALRSFPRRPLYARFPPNRDVHSCDQRRPLYVDSRRLSNVSMA
jgi:hypothetical protein